jgi:hypothetical protein
VEVKLELRRKKMIVKFKFLRCLKVSTRIDRIKSKDIRKELNIYSEDGRKDDYREKWLIHLNKMDGGSQRLALHYKQKGYRGL